MLRKRRKPRRRARTGTESALIRPLGRISSVSARELPRTLFQEVSWSFDVGRVWTSRAGSQRTPPDPAGPGGCVLDYSGGLHPFGGAPARAASGYWPGQDMARGIALIGGAQLGADTRWTPADECGDSAAHRRSR